MPKALSTSGAILTYASSRQNSRILLAICNIYGLKRKIFDVNYTIESVGFNSKDLKDEFSPLINEIRNTGIEIPV